MTTGATTRVAYLHEPVGNYMGSPSDTTYKTFFKDAVAREISLSNALQRMRQPGDPETVESLATLFEGALSVEGVISEPWYHNHVFGGTPTQSGAGPYTYTWTPVSGEMQSARVFAGVDFGSSIAERELMGFVPGSYTVNISRGSAVRATVTGFYGKETKNTALTPGSQPSTTGKPLIFHGGQLEIPNSSQIVRMDTATLRMTNLGRPQPQWERWPAAGVMGAVETSLQTTDVTTGTDILEEAYGTASDPAGNGSEVSGAADGTLSFSSAGTHALQYNLTRVTPNNYNWPDFGDPGLDVTEETEWNVDKIEAEATSDQDSAV